MQPDKSSARASALSALLVASFLSWLAGYMQGFEHGRYCGQMEALRGMIRRSYGRRGLGRE